MKEEVLYSASFFLQKHEFISYNNLKGPLMGKMEIYRGRQREKEGERERGREKN